MDIGRLNQRISIEQRTTSQDALGEPVESWGLVCLVWADIRHLSGLETIKSGAETAFVSASIRIRYRPDISAGMRITHGANTYDIKAILHDVSKKQFTDMVCEAY